MSHLATSKYAYLASLCPFESVRGETVKNTYLQQFSSGWLGSARSLPFPSRVELQDVRDFPFL